MPAQKHPSFLPPDGTDARLWRYIDLPKLISFLRTRSLYFAPMCDLQDELEGGLPRHGAAAIDQEFTRTERLAGRDPGDDPRYAEAMVRWVRAATYVNCWCCQEQESEALWRIYGFPSGVALTTTFSKLEQALPVQCWLGRVNYLDYDRNFPPPDNFFNLAIHKRLFFAHEHEVRAVSTVMPLHLTHVPPPHPSTPPFQTFPVEFAAFERIVLSPYAPDWHFPLVYDLVRRYECPIPVEHSAMTPKAADQQRPGFSLGGGGVVVSGEFDSRADFEREAEIVSVEAAPCCTKEAR